VNISITAWPVTGWFCAVLAALPAAGQATAVIQGRVIDPTGAPVSEAVVTVSNPVAGLHKRIETGIDGQFTVGNLPFQAYRIGVDREGFAPFRSEVAARSNVPVEVTVRLELTTVYQNLSVSANAGALLVDPGETGTRVQMNQNQIDRMALQAGNRGLEAVLATFPGFSMNANGAIHPRGAHNQMTFVIDGMPITDQLTGAFANAVDPNIVQTVDLYTGNIPAEYGSKVSAVASVTTRAGLGSGRRLGGTTTLSAAGFDTASQVTSLSGESGRVGYTVLANTMESHRYLDQVSLDNLHNGGNSARAFARADIQATGRDVVRLNALAGRSSFELANLRSQQENGMRQRQRLEDGSLSLGWVHLLSPVASIDSTVSYRSSRALLLPSPGDIPVTAWQDRRIETYTAWNRFNLTRGAHNLKAGIDGQWFPVREAFRFGVTSADFNRPGTEDYIATLAAHDLTRGGRQFTFARRSTGRLASGFVQDQVRLGRFQISAGLRFDDYRFLVRGSQWQPRVGFSFHLRETGTVLRASYNRTYQTPPNENLLLASSSESSVLVDPDARLTLGGALALIQPERQNFFEASVQQGVGSQVSVWASYYHKNSRDQQDNNNFFNTGVIFPMALASIRVNGLEGRMVLTPVRGFSGSLSITHARAVSTPPFTGGLFIGNSAVSLLNQGPFLIDHDQALAVHGVATWTSRRGFYTTASVRYDSGLVANPSDPEAVAADPDYADLLPLVNLTAAVPRVRPRTIADLVVGYERSRDGSKRWDLSLMLTNLTNRTALYNFQSIFVGTRLVQPRTAGVRLRIHF